MKKSLLFCVAAALAFASVAPMASADDWRYRGANAVSGSETGVAGGSVAGAATLGNGLAGAESYNGGLALNEGYAVGQATGNTALAESGNVSQFENLSGSTSFSLGNGGAMALGGGLGGADGFSEGYAWTNRGDD